MQINKTTQVPYLKRMLFLLFLLTTLAVVCYLRLYTHVLPYHAYTHGAKTLDLESKTTTVLLTLFTTFKNDSSRFSIHSNVLWNWAQFRPKIQPILFTTNTDRRLIDMAVEQGWVVMRSPRDSIHGVPYLKEMYTAAQNHSQSIFYGYSNGDLLFDEGLCDTLDIIRTFLPELNQTLVVGKRINFEIGARTLYRPTELRQVAEKGQLFRADAEDYFFIAHNRFPWNTVPDLVIGRPAYDNYLVGHAIRSNVSVVDATITLLALHQTGLDGNFAGHNNKDAGFNARAIGEFNYGTGFTSSAQYYTTYKTRGKEVQLWARPHRGHSKYQLPYKNLRRI